MELTVLPINVAMIFAMPGASAVTLPAAVLRPMIARQIAMTFAMLPPGRIGGMQVAMIAPDIAMIFPMTAARMVVTVLLRGNSSSGVDLRRLALDPLGALSTLGFIAYCAFGASSRTVTVIVRPGRTMVSIMPSGLAILRERRRRRYACQQE